MNEIPSSIKAPHEPQVNLLPPEVEARRARGRQRSAIVFVFALFLGALGFGVYWAFSQEAAAKDDLKAAQDRGAELEAQIGQYDYVVAIQTELLNAENVRTYVGSTEIDYPRLLNGMIGALPKGTTFDQLTWTVTTVDSTELPSADLDPFAIPDLGSVVLRGTVPEYVTTADLEEAFNTVVGLERTRITLIQQQERSDGDDYYLFEGTAQVNALALSGRFSSAWNESYAMTRAWSVVEERFTAATSAVTAAEAAVTAGEPGADEDLAEAQAALDVATEDNDQVLAFIDELVDGQRRVTLLAAGAAYGMEGAAQDLEEALAEFNEMWAVATDLAAAINAWDEEASNLATVEARIEAAEEYLDDCQERVDRLQGDVDDGVEGAVEALEEAEVWLARAEYELALERQFLEGTGGGTGLQEIGTEAAEASTRAALDEILQEVATYVDVDDSAAADDSEEANDSEEGGGS